MANRSAGSSLLQDFGVIVVAGSMLGCRMRLALWWLLAACSSGPREVTVAVDTSATIAVVNDRFLSVAVDTAEVVGGVFWDPAGGATQTPIAPYDFTRPALRALARELTPAYLRIGGTAADSTHIDVSDPPSGLPPPAGYQWVLTRAEWDGVVGFARDLDFQILFTMNAGIGPRVGGTWVPDDVQPLVELVQSRGDPVAVWELGNEINLYTLVGHQISGATYTGDLATARTFLGQAAPGAKLAGPSSAYWPTVGELVSFYPDLLAAGGVGDLDIITWHYYPQQSERCPLQLRAATPTTMLDPAHLDEVKQWATDVTTRRTDAGLTTEIWLGETGNAQCGGEPGVSDRFAATFWWLDQLGAISALDQQVMIRQTLSGSDYGLIDDATLAPRPDFWASVLWRRLMDTRVLAATSPDPSIRAYAHCTPNVPGDVTVLAINLSQTEELSVNAPSFGPSASTRYRVTAAGLDASDVALEGTTLSVGDDGSLPPLDGTPVTDAQIELPPMSWAFLTIDARADVCQ